MGPIDRVGTFRGTPAEWAIGKTKNEYPQFMVRLVATEKWIESADEMEAFGLTEAGWIPWAEYEQDITAYLVLFNNDGPIFNYEQVQAALGWDGASFSGLTEMDHLKTTVLFRVEENDWNGKISLQVAWVDEKDAPIERTLRALDPEKLRDMDSRYAGMMTAKKTAPASKPGKPAAPKAGAKKKAAGKSPPSGKPKSSPSKTPAPAEEPGAAVGAAPPTTGPPTVEASEASPPFIETCTMDEAWTAIQKAASDDDKAASVWVEAAESAGIEDQEAATGEDWANVRAKGLAVISA